MCFIIGVLPWMKAREESEDNRGSPSTSSVSGKEHQASSVLGHSFFSNYSASFQVGFFPPFMLYSNIKPRGFCFEMLPWMHPFHHPLTSGLFICCHGYSATFLLVPPPQVLIAKSRCCRNVLEHRELVVSAPRGHSSEDPRHL